MLCASHIGLIGLCLLGNCNMTLVKALRKDAVVSEKNYIPLGHVCVAKFRGKVNGFPRKTYFSCVWCGCFPRNPFFAMSSFSLLTMEIDFPWGGMGSLFPRKTTPPLYTSFPTQTINSNFL